MIRNLQLTIIEGARRLAGRGSRYGTRSLRAVSSRLGNPDDPVLLDPDNPDDPVLLDPDNPDDPVLLDPDNPDDPVLLDPDNPEGLYYALATQGALGAHGGCGCGCACNCAQEGGATAQRPGTRPRDYSGFLIVRTADHVEDGLENSLYDLAERYRLDGLRRVLDLQLDDAEADDGTAGDLPGVASLQVSGSFGRRRGEGGRGDVGKGGHGEGRGGGNAGGGGGATSYPQKPLPMPPHGPPAAPANGPLASYPAIVLGDLTDRKKTVETLKKLEAKATRRGFRPASSLSSYWRVDAGTHVEMADRLVERLNALPEIDLAYREVAVDEPLSADQNYLEEAPVGIGLTRFREQIEQLSTAGEESDDFTITLCDLEQQWHVEHEAFAHLVGDDQLGLLFGANRDDADEEDGYGHHGNAVLGQLVGRGRIEGGVGRFAKCVLASHYWSKSLTDTQGAPSAFAATNGHVAAAIVNSLAEPYELAELPADGRLKTGDVLLLEVQRGRYPTEIDPLDFDAIRLASALGVVVVEAAGNGGYDLDAYVDPDTGRSFNRRSRSFRDSGAIFVGAAYGALPHDRVPSSNYGSRLDCFGWGTGVTTCGYGNLAGNERSNLYTNTFNGTSSAAPVVAAAAVAVQWHHCVSDGNDDKHQPIGVREMRLLLSDPANGTRQGRRTRHQNIGVMPDLGRLLRQKLALVPDVYLRRHVGDDGGRPARDESISSSPDVVVTTGAGAGDPDLESVAPGGIVEASDDYELRLRLRNRGLGEGRVTVHAFACPATTLITPELWQPVGKQSVAAIPAGGLVREVEIGTGIKTPKPPGGRPAAPLSFLAVAVPDKAGAKDGTGDTDEPYPLPNPDPVLPPGPPYFDWREYRRFLRSPGVTWRNVHRREAKKGLVELPFVIAGTPDVARRFDFEVMQQLPAKAELSIRLHRDAADKLTQRQPSLKEEATASKDGPVDLALPRRPRLPIESQSLDAGTHVPAIFRVKSDSLDTGHSLAIRQLWRGIEVGRITWYFEK